MCLIEVAKHRRCTRCGIFEVTLFLLPLRGKHNKFKMKFTSLRKLMIIPALI